MAIWPFTIPDSLGPAGRLYRSIRRRFTTLRYEDDTRMRKGDRVVDWYGGSGFLRTIREDKCGCVLVDYDDRGPVWISPDKLEREVQP